ncbi:MAG: mechanosensitive ion channel [Desulfobulbaceae bacterium]|nr:mechanosensitive ion channel [Desulfobulbaceae bacterium]
MKNNLTWLSWLLWLTIVLAMGPKVALAAECPSDIKAVTNDDANVPIEILVHQVKPLTKCELEAEAKAWLLLLQEKVAEISTTEVAAIHEKKEIEEAEQAGEAGEALQEAEKKTPQDETQQKVVEAVKSKVEKEAESATTPEEAKEETADLKTALIKHITGLMAERTLLIDRFKVVLAELAAKGGETTEYDTYIKAVSGLKVDVTDVSATWTTISGWLMSAEGGFRWAFNIAQFIIIIVVFYFLSIVAGKAANKALSKTKNFSTLLQDFLALTARRLVLFVGLFVGLSALEINLGPVLAVIGAAGFVIAFALQNSLSNFASGILMLLYRPFDVSDFISVAGTLGKVESMNLLSTQLRTPDNQLVIVPNNSVWGDVIINVTGITERRVDLVFGIGYSDDIDKAQQILEEIVLGHELVLKDFEAVVKLHELADSSVNFICRPWVRPDHYWDVYWDITKEVKRRFDAEGISIPFPQSDVHIFQESS